MIVTRGRRPGQTRAERSPNTACLLTLSFDAPNRPSSAPAAHASTLDTRRALLPQAYRCRS